MKPDLSQITESEKTTVRGSRRQDLPRPARSVALLIALFAAAMATGCDTVKSLSPSCTAEGLIEVHPGWPDQSGAAAQGYADVVPSELYPLYVMSHVAGIKSEKVLVAALENLKGQQTLYTGPTVMAAHDLQEDLKVEHVAGTFHISVSLTGADPMHVTHIVREVMTQYVEQLRADRMQAEMDRHQALRMERDDLRQQLDELGRKLASYRHESGVIVSHEPPAHQLARLTALASQLTQAQLGLAKVRADWARFQQVKKQADEKEGVSHVLAEFPDIAERLEGHPVLRVLTDRVTHLELHVATAQAGAPKGESASGAEAALQAARRLLESKRAERTQQLVARHAATLKSRYDRARQVEAELQMRFSEARAEALLATKLVEGFDARRREYLRVEQFLNEVMTDLERMRIRAALAVPNVRIVQLPTIPIE